MTTFLTDLVVISLCTSLRVFRKSDAEKCAAMVGKKRLSLK